MKSIKKNFKRKNEYAKIHKKEISAYKREFNARLCYDPKENNYCTLSELRTTLKGGGFLFSLHQLILRFRI